MREAVAGHIMRGRVLVTRPMPDALTTAEMVRAAGYEPLLLPLTGLEPTHIALPRREFSAVAVTSANALRHADKAQLAYYLHLPLYAVGQKTADVARETGFTHIYSGDGWGLNLGRHVAETLPSNSRVLYLTGKIRRPDFEAQLVAAGVVPVVAETYDTIALHYDNAQLAVVLSGARSAEIVLLYSAVAAQQLVMIDQRLNGTLLSGAKHIFCLSGRIAAELPHYVQTMVQISDTPDEAALLALLQRLKL